MHACSVRGCIWWEVCFDVFVSFTFSVQSRFDGSMLLQEGQQVTAYLLTLDVVKGHVEMSAEPPTLPMPINQTLEDLILSSGAAKQGKEGSPDEVLCDPPLAALHPAYWHSRQRCKHCLFKDVSMLLIQFAYSTEFSLGLSVKAVGFVQDTSNQKWSQVWNVHGAGG